MTSSPKALEKSSFSMVLPMVAKRHVPSKSARTRRWGRSTIHSISCSPPPKSANHHPALNPSRGEEAGPVGFIGDPLRAAVGVAEVSPGVELLDVRVEEGAGVEAVEVIGAKGRAADVAVEGVEDSLGA